MKKLITGLHHITALASDAQKNYDFYSGVLDSMDYWIKRLDLYKFKD